MIRELNIPVYHAMVCTIEPKHKIIVVDGCKGNKNVSDLKGEEIAVIDHHNSRAPDDVSFVDIRPDYGSTSTIINTYLEECNIEPSESIASALLIGLILDTSHLTRGISKADLMCHTALFEKADNQFVNRLLRNNIQQQDLRYFRKALEKAGIQERFAFCFFEEGCNQNLLGIIANFFLSVQEVNFVFLCAQNGNKINFSLRSEEPRWNAADIIRTIMGGIVFGGGHPDMAGGVIEDAAKFDVQRCFEELRAILLSED
jgi:nanoRNase/pAp phosphatase (c-di-AMP/oligoRNAs hydrolase)